LCDKSICNYKKYNTVAKKSVNDALSVLDIQNVKPKDVITTAVSKNKSEISYMQSWKAKQVTKCKMKFEPKLAYQLLIPYLVSLIFFNENTTICGTNTNGNMLRCFAWPGFINSTFKYAVPVISLDACHQKGDRKVTLYLATAQS
jgi:hypothetical protein